MATNTDPNLINDLNAVLREYGICDAVEAAKTMGWYDVLSLKEIMALGEGAKVVDRNGDVWEVADICETVVRAFGPFRKALAGPALLTEEDIETVPIPQLIYDVYGQAWSVHRLSVDDGCGSDETFLELCDPDVRYPGYRESDGKLRTVSYALTNYGPFTWVRL